MVGTHYYVVGSLPWGVKVAVSMVGLGGSKDKGIEYLYDVGRGGGENCIDAQVVLSLFLRREHRYQEALTIMRGLIPLYPRNVLFALEEGNLLRDDGHNQEAAAVYRKIWQAGRSGHFAGLHYEMAALGLGDLLRSQKDYDGAAAAYDEVSQVSQPDPEVLQKADLGAGEMYDLLQKHDLAVKKYQAVIAADQNSAAGGNGPKSFERALSGRRVVRGTFPSKSPYSNQDGGVMYCNYCGKAIQDDANHCAYCGTRVGGSIARKRLVRPRADRKLRECARVLRSISIWMFRWSGWSG